MNNLNTQNENGGNAKSIINRIPDDGMEKLYSLIGKKLAMICAPNIQYYTLFDYYDLPRRCAVRAQNAPKVMLGTSFEELENGLDSPAFVIGEGSDTPELPADVDNCKSRIFFFGLNDYIDNIAVYETIISNKPRPESVTYDSHIVLELASGKSVIFETVSIPKGFIRMRICDTEKAESIIRNDHGSIFDPSVRCRIKPEKSPLKRIELSGNDVMEVDQRKNHDVYHSHLYPKKPCECDDCAAFRRGVDRISDEAKRFFTRLNIDPAKPQEVYTCGRSNLGTVYDGWYHVCGRVISSSAKGEHHALHPNALYENTRRVEMKGYVAVAPDLLVSVSEKCTMLPEDFPTPAFDIEVQIIIPD